MASSLRGPANKNVRWRLLWCEMEKPDYSCQKAGNNAARCFVSPVFKGICSSIRFRKQLPTCCWENYGKEFTFYQLCFPYPPVAFAGCGNRQDFGHCCSEIAFTDQSTRRGCIQPGKPVAWHSTIVHRDGQCTLSLVWTQRTKGRFYCKVWQVSFADVLSLSLAPSLAVYLQFPYMYYFTF